MNLELNPNSLISIVMPTYNQSEFLAYSIESVLSQSFTNWELLIVDNFSSDETTKVLKNFLDPRIKVFQINNGGIIAKSRNLAIESSKGSWIAFLDSDDFWYPDKLETVSKYFETNCDLIYHDMQVVKSNLDQNYNDKIKSRKLRKPILNDLIINGNTIATSTVVVRKSRLVEVNGMNESRELIGVEDYNTWLRISRRTESFKLVSLELGAYRKHIGNNSGSYDFSLQFEAFKEFLHLLSNHEKKLVSLNYMYTSARLKYLARNHKNLIHELKFLVFKGTIIIKVKSFWMLMNLIKKSFFS